jgi:site-specific recombinase
VLLWLSSVAAGWIENWAVYRRLPEAIAEHRISRIVGRRVTGWAGRAFLRNIAGFGGNTAIGVLLGMTPVMGKFFGLPLDVRHVTLSAGALTLSVCSLGPQILTTRAFLGAAAGMVVIGILNFGVSFTLALMVALRARGADRSDRKRLWLSVFATFFHSPLQFVFPPKSESAARVHGPVSVAPKPH